MHVSARMPVCVSVYVVGDCMRWTQRATVLHPVALVRGEIRLLLPKQQNLLWTSAVRLVSTLTGGNFFYQSLLESWQFISGGAMG